VTKYEEDIRKQQEKLVAPVLALQIYDLAYCPGKDASKLSREERDELEDLFEKLGATEGCEELKSKLEEITKRKLKQE